MTEVEVQRALLSGDPQDQIAIAYNLIIDNKRFVDEGRFGQSTSLLGIELIVGSVSAMHFSRSRVLGYYWKIFGASFDIDELSNP